MKNPAEEHILVPKHLKLNEKEKQDILKKYSIASKDLPKIRKDDPAIAKLNADANDVIKILRKSPTAGEAVFYRGVANE